MAEEGTLVQARASRDKDGDDGEPSKQELQRRMEEARENITQTVTEIKETVTNQYYSMKETVSDALDWRHHFRRNPVAFSVGALSVGFLVGYGLTGAIKGGGTSDRREEDYPSAGDTDVFARTGATPAPYEEAERHTAFHGHSYAAQAITDTPRTAVGSSGDEERASDYGASYSYNAPAEASADAPQKPGLLDRFKETTAYDRLQTEVSSLGERFMEELSSTAHHVVLPALFNKIKELFGVDLGGKQAQAGQSDQAVGGASASGGEASTGARAASAGASSGASASLASASRGSSASSYGTSENRDYGAQSGERGGASGTDNSVLDLDR